MYKQKNWLQASRCYQQLAARIKGPSLKPSERYQKGRWLRNAALLQRKAALQTSQRPERLYLLEEVARKFDRYLKTKLYETRYQAQLARTMRDKVLGQIGYANLLVKCRSHKGLIAISGHKFEDSSRHTWQRQLRPGRYEIKVTYPGRPAVTRSVTLAPGSRRQLAIAPPEVSPTPRRRQPVPPPPTRHWGWIVVGVGAAAVIGGVVLFGVGASTLAQRDALQQQANAGTLPPGTTADDFIALDDAATWQLALGGGLVAAGSVAAIIGVVAQATAPTVPATGQAMLRPHHTAYASPFARRQTP